MQISLITFRDVLREVVYICVNKRAGTKHIRNTAHMDTDDFSVEAYKAIMIEAERFNHDLTLRFGLLSYSCENENEFVKKSVDLINEMMNLELEEIDDIFFGNPPEINEFQLALKRILENIDRLEKIPLEKRTYD